MLVSMKEMLFDAKKNRYALPAFDISNYEMLRAVLETCEEERSPALLMALGVDLEGRGLVLMASMVKALSAHFDIPVCFHLDHAKDLEFIKAACDAGFSSVMFDGSTLPFDENARLTRSVTDYAHPIGVTVEAELGHVGNAFVGNPYDHALDEDPETSLTAPEEAARFIELTQADALAVAIGTAHGVYKKTPRLRIDRLDAIASVCSCPLVLHGGSGTPEVQLREAIAHGISKINIFSDVLCALNGGLADTVKKMENPATWPCFVFSESRKRMKEIVREKLRSFGSAGKA